MEIETTTTQASTFVDKAEKELNEYKKQKKSNPNPYCSTAWLPPTSNMCERLFSRAKLIFSEII